MSDRVCLVTGVGPGTGSALVRRFAADGYRVAMLARTDSRLRELAEKVPGASAFPCDVSDEAQVAATTARISRELGPVNVLVHNAVGGAWGDFQRIEPAVLQGNFSVNVMALLYLARAVAPAMIKAAFAGFAPTKAAQRVLTESMARALGPRGIHVAYLAIDAVIDVPWARERLPDKPDDFFAKPSAIAEVAFSIAHQDRSTWAFDVVVRPFAEPW